MIADKSRARYHSVVITEFVPGDVLEFEHAMEKKLKACLINNSVYLHFNLGMGEDSEYLESGIQVLEEEFSEIGKTPFSICRFDHKDAGKTTIYYWKNPHFDILGRSVKKIEFMPSYGLIYF